MFGIYIGGWQATAQVLAIALADKLRDEWETLAEQVTELVAEHISPIASLFIGQWLQGQGTLPFDLIARVVVRKNEEVSA